MTYLYNCKHDGDLFRVTKFDGDFNVESSYLCTLTECDCPAGHRPRCRHREMLPKFIQRGHVGDEWFYDHDRGGWVQGASRDLEDNLSKSNEQLIAEAQSLEPSLTIATQREILIGDTNADWESSSTPEGLGQTSEQRPSPKPHSPMATTTDFESVDDGSSPSVAAKTTIRRRV